MKLKILGAKTYLGITMALTFLSLTNSVITRMNEVELTSSNFTSSRGIQTQCKNSVNEAIRYINQTEFGYSFNHASNSSTLIAGQARYTIPTSTKSIDYSTARIKKDSDLNAAGNNLATLNYREYIEKDYANKEDDVVATTLNGSHSDSVATLTLASTTGLDATGTVHIGGEQVTYTGISGNDITGCTRGANSTTAATHADEVAVTQFDAGSIPRSIVRTPDNNYLLYPYPDKAYTLAFDYYTFPSDLSAHGDTTTIPERFAPVVVDGATAYVYQYRGELQQYQLNFARFEEGIKNMRSLLINKYEYIRSTVTNRPSSSANFMSGVN
jgi:hypothetical protein|tara:strand:- start:286 stop:1266 length:981 start_codon:yes stop_codon:yes gene_type:complete